MRATLARSLLLVLLVLSVILPGCIDGDRDQKVGTVPDASPFGHAVNLGGPINSDSSEYNPEMSEDGLIFVFSSRRAGGYGSNDLWMSTRPHRGAPWGEPMNLGPAVNTEHWETGASLAMGGLELYFTSTRPGPGGRDLYVARRSSLDQPFDHVEALPGPINTDHTDSGPYVSEDALTLVFSSTRPGGQGNRDLYMSTRPSRDVPFGPPRNLGPAVNSDVDDSSPAMTQDKLTLFFHSRRRDPDGKHDIWVTHRASPDAPWVKAISLDRINTSAHEGTPSISADGRYLFFRSDRNGGFGYQDIWVLLEPLEGLEFDAPTTDPSEEAGRDPAIARFLHPGRGVVDTPTSKRGMD